MAALLRGKPGRWPAGAAHLRHRLGCAAAARLVRASGRAWLCRDAGGRACNQRRHRMGGCAPRRAVGVHSPDAARAWAWYRNRAHHANARVSAADLSYRSCVVRKEALVGRIGKQDKKSAPLQRTSLVRPPTACVHRILTLVARKERAQKGGKKGARTQRVGIRIWVTAIIRLRIGTIA